MDTIRPPANTPDPARLGLLERRLVFLLGKGGVGRSTLAAAFGVLAARRGLRAIVVEVSGRGDVPRLFGRGGESGVELELSPGLWTLDVDPRQALEEYLRDQLPLRLLADAIGSSATFGYVAAATPGLRELLTIGKIWELAQTERRTPGAAVYDVVVVDAPATGHGLALLAAPRTFADAAAAGPIARQGRRIAATLADRRLTALAAVATPESAAVEELLELRRTLDGRMDAVLANAVVAERFSAADALALRGAHAQPKLSAPARGALATAIAEDALARAQRAQLARLPAPLVLPLISAQISRAELETLADALEAVL
ncbi:MAG TPA: ArsA-related P-loop ATPase [Solirubrobacteraceae bacterium]